MEEAETGESNGAAIKKSSGRVFYSFIVRKSYNKKRPRI
jgi:hypothetical protein